MKTETVKIYRCEYCRKYGISASSISRHEKYCGNNPNNKHKCFDFCTFLKKENQTFRYHNEVVFTCEKKCKNLFSYKLEKLASLNTGNSSYFGTQINEMERMPLECEHFKPMSYIELEDRFDVESNDF